MAQRRIAKEIKDEIFAKVKLGEKDILYVNRGSCKNPEKYVKTLSEIKRSDGTTAFKIEVVVK